MKRYPGFAVQRSVARICPGIVRLHQSLQRMIGRASCDRGSLHMHNLSLPSLCVMLFLVFDTYPSSVILIPRDFHFYNWRFGTFNESASL